MAIFNSMLERINEGTLNKYSCEMNENGKITIYQTTSRKVFTIVSGLNLNEAFLFLSGMLEALNEL